MKNVAQKCGNSHKRNAEYLEAFLDGAKKVLQKTRCCTVEVSFYDFYENSSSLLLVEQAMQNNGMILWDISKVSKNPKNLRTDWAELVFVSRGQ